MGSPMVVLEPKCLSPDISAIISELLEKKGKMKVVAVNYASAQIKANNKELCVSVLCIHLTDTILDPRVSQSSNTHNIQLETLRNEQKIRPCKFIMIICTRVISKKAQIFCYMRSTRAIHQESSICMF